MKKTTKLLLTLALLCPLYLVGCKGNNVAPTSSEEKSSETSSSSSSSSVEKEMVRKPTLNKTSMTFNGIFQSVEVVGDDLDKVTIAPGSQKVAMYAGTYKVTVMLNNKDTQEWTDGTTDDLQLEWSITQATAEDVEYTFLSVNDVQNVGNVEYHLPAIEQDIRLSYYVKFKTVGIPIGMSNASITLDHAEQGSTLVDNFVYLNGLHDKVYVNVAVDDQNITLETKQYGISFVEPEYETIKYSYENCIEFNNYGANFPIVDDFSSSLTFYDESEDYFLGLGHYAGSSGFRIGTKMTCVKKVTFKFHQVGCLSSMEVYASHNEDNYQGQPGDVSVSHGISSLTEDNELVFEFDQTKFQPEEGYYYLKFWFSLNSVEEDPENLCLVESITIDYLDSRQEMK